tara:strand:+ start:189 stop:413 length:225 start_codon:yes stop_codon:yes gene_type:complete
MPKNSWFKHLWNWRKNKNNNKKKGLYRTRRMESFKFKKISNMSVKAYDSQGKDISHLIKHSFVYEGVPGGFYIE